MYKLKTFAQRSMMLGAAAMLVTASLPPVQVFAYNELNPLTERSLLLSSSAPGYVDTDGSGNSTDRPNPTGNAYAPAGSGANGKKTGQTFSFRVSTDSVRDSRAIQGFTFQYCTTAAGLCQAPGDANGASNEDAWAAGRSDLEVNHGNAEEDFVPFNIYMTDIDGDGEELETETDVTGDWTMTAVNDEDASETTGKRNLIRLTSATGVSPVFNQKLRIVFNTSELNYITNPGGGSFFVKINTYDSADPDDHVPGSERNIDGGVTVANMMTDSIHITTKVLETMSFSVGVDLPEQAPGEDFTQCHPIVVTPEKRNRINLGNPEAEYSLEKDRAHEQKSYWRIQSNSSGGATVYYSGDTLRNTVGDEIQAMSTVKVGVGLKNPDGSPNYLAYGDPVFDESRPASEQFGLALVEASNASLEDGGDVSEDYNTAVAASGGVLESLTIDPLNTDETRYDLEAGEGNAKTNPGTPGQWLDAEGSPTTDFAKFGFTPRSVVQPEPLASGTSVLSCTTGKMRYVGNIAADTPAGVYTTKINYLAAPKY